MPPRATSLPCARPLFAGLLLAAFPVSSQSARILAVDFGRNDSLADGVAGTTGTRRETGFEQFFINGTSEYTGVVSLTYYDTDPLLTSGGITVNLQGDPTGAAGGIGGRHRSAPLDSGTFSYGDLLSDGIVRTKLTSTPGDFTLELLGLNPNTTFHLRLWSASSGSDIDTTFSWYDTTLGSVHLGDIFNGPGSPLTATHNHDFSVAGLVTTDSQGSLLLGLTSSNGSPTAGFINGFELSTVPEPSSLALAAAGAGWLATNRRRRLA